MGGQFGQSRRLYSLDRRLAAHLCEKVVDQQRQVLGMLGQRRGADQEDGQSIIEVRAKAAALGQLGQRLVGGCHDAHIHPHSFVVAHPLQLAALDKAQQLGLQPQRHLANLIQKQRTAVGGLNPAYAPLYRTGESSARMAKEFGFKKRFGNRRAVDGNKGFMTTG